MGHSDNRLPSRKHPRLKQYDYGTAGEYFITICTHERKCLLSRISEPIPPSSDVATAYDHRHTWSAGIEYTEYGKTAERQLFGLENRHAGLRVDRYVIMPNHIHVILIIDYEAARASPHPTIMDIVCAYKSLTTRECKKIGLNEKLFQSSFYEHVIRNSDDYNEISNYIYNNPVRWFFDELYNEQP